MCRLVYFRPISVLVTCYDVFICNEIPYCFSVHFKLVAEFITPPSVYSGPSCSKHRYKLNKLVKRPTR